MWAHYFASVVFVFSGWSFQMGSAYQFHSWRVFVLVCAFPSVAAIAALSAMPESPRFYLEVRGCACWLRQPVLLMYESLWGLILSKDFKWRRIKTWRCHWKVRLFFQNGKHDEGWMILKQVHDTNMRAKGHPEKVFSVSICETILFYQIINSSPESIIL